MAFIRVWVSYAWVWYYEGLLCQVLAIKGEKGELAQLRCYCCCFYKWLLLMFTNVKIRCQVVIICVTYVCDLWSELWTHLSPMFWVIRGGGWFSIKELLRVLLFHHWSSMFRRCSWIEGEYKLSFAIFFLVCINQTSGLSFLLSWN